MGKGFIRGVIAGAFVSLLSVSVASILNSRDAAMREGASSSQPQTPAEPALGASAPEPDTITSVINSDIVPSAQPEAGASAGMDGLAPVDEADGVNAPAQPASVAPNAVVSTPERPVTEPQLSISTDPAQPPAPQIEPVQSALADPVQPQAPEPAQDAVVVDTSEAQEPAPDSVSDQANAASQAAAAAEQAAQQAADAAADASSQEAALQSDAEAAAVAAAAAAAQSAREIEEQAAAAAQAARAAEEQATRDAQAAAQAQAQDEQARRAAEEARLAAEAEAAAEAERAAAQAQADAAAAQAAEDARAAEAARIAAEAEAEAEAEAARVTQDTTEAEAPTADTEIAALPDPERLPVVQTPDTQDAMPAPAATPDVVQNTQEPLRPAIGRPVDTLTDIANGVRTNRLPTAQAPTTLAPTDVTPEADALVLDTLPLLRYATPFENPDAKPLMSIVLMDDGADLTGGPIGLEALSSFPYPITFAVDATLPDAADRMAAYRADGFEVLAMIDLPPGATAVDAEVSVASALSTVPEAVAIMEGVGSGVQTTRAAAEQVAAILSATGHGFVTQNRGLNTPQKLAARAGVPSAVIFRDFDAEGQTPTVIRRFLDRAAFRARQEGGVIMLGRLREDTISALLVWGLQDRAGQVALAPVSAVLNGS